MSLVLDLLQSLGAPTQFIIMAAVMMIAWYLFKSIKIGKMLGAVFGTIAQYTIVVLVAVALAIGFGWFELNPGTATSQLGFVGSVGGDVLGAVLNWLGERVSIEVSL